jgi:hypothetical protein
MNKFVALALAACLFTAVSANNSTGNGTTASWCRANTDCNESQSFCCSANGALGYLQFNCNRHTNGNTTVGKCITNGTDYTELCAGQAKICTSTASKAAYCGGSAAMFVVDAFPNVECTSSAYSLMMSVAFFAMVALSYVF